VGSAALVLVKSMRLSVPGMAHWIGSFRIPLISSSVRQGRKGRGGTWVHTRRLAWPSSMWVGGLLRPLVQGPPCPAAATADTCAICPGVAPLRDDANKIGGAAMQDVRRVVKARRPNL